MLTSLASAARPRSPPKSFRALGPVFVFALEQLDGRLHYSSPTLACILVYSASVIVSNIAHGWSDELPRSRRPAGKVQSQVAQQQS
jgi:hypothetical protein